jgi:glyoxalase family protein
MSVLGIHHVTAISGDAQENVNFYAGLLGMRLVKRSVNQDDPGTYHLFYADAAGHPGSDLTFFPWAHMAPGRLGAGLIWEVGLAVPAGSLPFWQRRLADAGARAGEPATRFDERVLPLTDPHGQSLVLVETADERDFTPWDRSPVPPDAQIRRLHGVRMVEPDAGNTARALEQLLGYAPLADQDGWRRFQVGAGGSGRVLDVREASDAARGRWGRGTVHHVAFRVPDDATQLALRERVAAAGLRPTPVIDRFWFRSVYFLEPGGVLFELATDGPGFAVDEDPGHLGERLVLPPWLEPERHAIEAALPPLRYPPSQGPRVTNSAM